MTFGDTFEEWCAESAYDDEQDALLDAHPRNDPRPVQQPDADQAAA